MTKIKTTEMYKKEVYELVGDEYVLLEDYINAKTKVKLLHKSCGNIYEVLPGSFRNGKRCSTCSGNKKLNTQSFKEKVFEDVGDEYSVLGEYTNGVTIILIKHNTCGHVYNVTPGNFLKGKRCPNCSKYKKKTTEDFVREVYILEKDNYCVIGEFIRNNIPVLIKHNVCGHVYEVYRYNFLSGCRCPKCKSSHGEIKIATWLRNNDIKFKQEFKFDDCKNKYPLPFDFAIIKNKKVNVLIEYDGIQHFEPFEHFGGDEKFKQTQTNDRIKNEYCKDNNIPLLRIPYWEFDNIESILEDFLFNIK